MCFFMRRIPGLAMFLALAAFVIPILVIIIGLEGDKRMEVKNQWADRRSKY